MPNASPAADSTVMVAAAAVIVGATVVIWLVFCERISEPALRFTPLPNVLPVKVRLFVPAVTPVPVVMAMVFPAMPMMDSPAGMPVPLTPMPTESPPAFVTVNMLVFATVVPVTAIAHR